jgi:cytochrome c biogenesis protein CcmG/thiol:disulfide interchange protein DsbE
MRMQEGTYDPHKLPSMLVGKPLPAFNLPGQPPLAGFSSRDIIGERRPALVNFFASWCPPCVEEAPTLMQLRQEGVPIWGIAYKDKLEATAQFLSQHGDPFVRVARDETGRVAINFGLYGLPETYVVDPAGVVRMRWAGGLSETVVRDNIAPMLKSLAA